jgi:flagellar biosynthesis protein FlhG
MTERNRLIAIASGKGGVGKTWFAATLAHALAMQRLRVLLVDGDLGLANVDIQLGIMPKYDLGHVLSFAQPAGAAIVRIPAGGFDLLAGRSGSGALAVLDPAGLMRFSDTLNEVKQLYETTLLDCGAGLDPAAQMMVETADVLLLMITEDPTSLTDAYAVLKCLLRVRRGAAPDVRVVVNQAGSPAAGLRAFETLANATAGFLNFKPALAGIIRRDDRVRDAIRRQSLLLSRAPQSIAGHDVEQIALKLLAGVGEKMLHV